MQTKNGTKANVDSRILGLVTVVLNLNFIDSSLRAVYIQFKVNYCCILLNDSYLVNRVVNDAGKK